MILIDTEIMRQLVSICSSAARSIDEAVDSLNRVTMHNDWGCRERESINESTNRNKTLIRALQEKSRSFLNALTLVSQDFENAENSISDMFSSLESIIGSAIAIPTVIDTGTWGGTWKPPINRTSFTDIFDWWFQNNNSSGYRPGIDVIHRQNGEVIGPGYNPKTGEGVFHYDENGNLLYAEMTAPLPMERYEISSFSAAPTVCNFSDLSLDGGD